MSLNKEKYRAQLEQLSVKELKVRRLAALKNDAKDMLPLLDEALDKKLPGWRKPNHFGMPQPTVVRWRDEEIEFPSQIAAYIYLIEKFIEHQPGLFDKQDWRTEFVSKGRAGHFFARSPNDLWDKSSHLAEEGQYTRLPNGWFANTNLSSKQKLDILLRLEAAAKVSSDDWSISLKGADDVTTLDDLL